MEITIILVEHGTLIWLQIKRPEPYKLSTITPLVVNHVINLVHLVKKANPYQRNKEHKKKLKRNISIKVTIVGASTST